MQKLLSVIFSTLFLLSGCKKEPPKQIINDTGMFRLDAERRGSERLVQALTHNTISPTQVYVLANAEVRDIIPFNQEYHTGDIVKGKDGFRYIYVKSRDVAGDPYNEWLLYDVVGYDIKPLIFNNLKGSASTVSDTVKNKYLMLTVDNEYVRPIVQKILNHEKDK